MPTSPPRGSSSGSGSAKAALAASVLGFFVITLDALVVNVALPDIHKDLAGGITGLQWVIDGYTRSPRCCCRPGRSATGSGRTARSESAWRCSSSPRPGAGSPPVWAC